MTNVSASILQADNVWRNGACGCVNCTRSAHSCKLFNANRKRHNLCKTLKNHLRFICRIVDHSWFWLAFRILDTRRYVNECCGYDRAFSACHISACERVR